MRPAFRLALLLCAAVLAAGGCASLDNWQRAAIFQPTAAAHSASSPPPAGTEVFDLAAADGGRVRAWFLGADGTAAKDAPTVLFLHGARRDLNGNVTRIGRLHALGMNVLAIDYRGFGESSAILPSEASAIEDARIGFEELKRRQPDATRRFVYGYSLGGALAIDLAANGDGFAGLVVESTFTRIADLVRESRWGWIPFIGLAVTQEFDSMARIARVNEPLLVLHGTGDGVVPHEMADRLAAAAAGVPARLKRVVKFEGAGHRGVVASGDERFDRALREFVDSARHAAIATLSAAAALAR